MRLVKRKIEWLRPAILVRKTKGGNTGSTDHAIDAQLRCCLEDVKLANDIVCIDNLWGNEEGEGIAPGEPQHRLLPMLQIPAPDYIGQPSSAVPLHSYLSLYPPPIPLSPVRGEAQPPPGLRCPIRTCDDNVHSMYPLSF